MEGRGGPAVEVREETCRTGLAGRLTAGRAVTLRGHRPVSVRKPPREMHVGKRPRDLALPWPHQPHENRASRPWGRSGFRASERAIREDVCEQKGAGTSQPGALGSSQRLVL